MYKGPRILAGGEENSLDNKSGELRDCLHNALKSFKEHVQEV